MGYLCKIGSWTFQRIFNIPTNHFVLQNVEKCNLLAYVSTSFEMPGCRNFNFDSLNYNVC